MGITSVKARSGRFRATKRRPVGRPRWFGMQL